MDLHELLLSFSYLAIFLLMVANGITNLPSSQFLYVIAGYFVSTGNLAFIPAVLAGSIGNAIGNIITFSLVKKYGENLARKLLMLDKNTFEKIHTALHETFSQKGMVWIFLGKLTPSVKAFIPVVAGLAHTRTYLTSVIFLVASFIWACAIVSIGYFFGEHVSFKSFTAISLSVGLIILFVVYRKLKAKGVF